MSWQAVWREPLVHFLGIAALLFVANAVFSGDEREVITVDLATQDYLIQEQQDLRLRPLSQQEQRAIIETFVEEEILQREARKRGFDNSSRIRTLLIQNMRFFLANDFPTATEEDLRAFFNENLSLFETRPRVSYEHVQFDDPSTVPEDTLSQLRGGADHTKMGRQDVPGGHRLVRVDERSIVATFGQRIARDVLTIVDDQWHGPFESSQGAHFLRVIERHPARRPEFEDARSWVEAEWNRAQQNAIMDRELALMRQNYRVEIEPSAESD